MTDVLKVESEVIQGSSQVTKLHVFEINHSKLKFVPA